MEKRNNCVKVGFSTILLIVLAILLCAAPCGALTGPQTVGLGDTLNLGTDYAPDNVGVDDGSVNVYGTLNMYPGAYVDWYVTANNGSTVNIEGGTVALWVSVNLGSNVTVYGTSFTFQEEPHFAGEELFISTTHPDYLGPLTVVYENNQEVDLPIDCYWQKENGQIVNATIKLAAPGGDSITVNIEKAKVSWDHSDIHVYGKLYLPQGFWMDTLDRVGGVVTTLAGVGVANQDDVEFELKGKKGDKWEYKDKENLYGNLKEFKIDWKGAKFDYKGDEGLHIHTHFIGGTETTLCIHCDHISGAFTVSVNGTTIAYNEDRIIATDVEYDPQKDDNTHVHFTLPFQLSPDMTIEVSEVVLSIAVADYYEEGFVKFKLISVFNPDSSWDSSDELKCVISLGLGDDMIAGSDLIGGEKGWTNKDDKHWDYK